MDKIYTLQGTSIFPYFFPVWWSHGRTVPWRVYLPAPPALTGTSWRRTNCAASTSWISVSFWENVWGSYECHRPNLLVVVVAVVVFAYIYIICINTIIFLLDCNQLHFFSSESFGSCWLAAIKRSVHKCQRALGRRPTTPMPSPRQ